MGTFVMRGESVERGHCKESAAVGIVRDGKLTGGVGGYSVGSRKSGEAWSEQCRVTF